MGDIDALFLTGDPSASGRRATGLVVSALLVAAPGHVGRADLLELMEATKKGSTLDVALNHARRWFAGRGVGIAFDGTTRRYSLQPFDHPGPSDRSQLLEEMEVHVRRLRRAVASYRRSSTHRVEVFEGLLDLGAVRAGTAFPAGSVMHALLVRHRLEPLVRLCAPLLPSQGSDPADPTGRGVVPSTERWTIAAVEGGAETVRIYSSSPTEGTPQVEEFPGSANVSSEDPLASTLHALQLLAERAGTARHDRVACVVALSGLMRHNGQQISLDVKDLIFDCGLRGIFYIVNDGVPPLLPGLAGLDADRYVNVSVKVGAGSVVTALVPAAGGGLDVMRFGGAEYLFTDQGSGFHIALHAFRQAIAELYDARFGRLERASALAMEAARFVARRTVTADGRHQTDAELDEAIRSIQTASGRWSHDAGMKRRVSAFTRVVCDLADGGDPTARRIVRNSATQLGHLTALAASQIDGPPIVEVVGRIPSTCRTYRSTFDRTVRDRLAEDGRQASIRHRLESIATAHRFAGHLHQRYQAGGEQAVIGLDLPNLAGYLQVIH